MHCHVTSEAKVHAACLALEGLLARVHAHVHVELGHLDEALAAGGAAVRSLNVVDLGVQPQARHLHEGLVAQLAGVRPLSRVRHAHVDPQLGCVDESGAARLAHVGLLARVPHAHVVFEGAAVSKPLTSGLAGVRLLARVDPHVGVEDLQVDKRGAAPRRSGSPSGTSGPTSG